MHDNFVGRRILDGRRTNRSLRLPYGPCNLFGPLDLKRRPGLAAKRPAYQDKPADYRRNHQHSKAQHDLDAGLQPALSKQLFSPWHRLSNLRHKNRPLLVI